MHKYLFILLIFPTVCFSKTSVWHISKNGNELYLGGTIHLLKKEDYPLPIEFNQAFKKSDKLIFETDIEAAQTPEFGQKVAQALTYPAGQSLKGKINDKAFNALKKYLSEKNIPLEHFLSYKPSMVSLAISIIELQQMDMVAIGVDEHFHNKAKRAGKEIEYFEAIEEQLEFLRSMGEGNESEMILNTINDVSQLQATMAEIKSAWLSGDANKMADVTLTEMIRDYPELYQSLLVERNNNWMPYLEKMIKNKTVEMVLVGALHLVGKDGLLQQLRNKGYVVKQFKQN